MQIGIVVSGRKAAAVGTPRIVCGNSDIVIAFTFDAEWGDYNEKTAVFSFLKDGKHGEERVTFTGSACYAPVLTGIDRVEVGVIAGQIRTTTPAIVPCGLSITDYASEEYEPETDAYNEIMEQRALMPLPELEDDEYFITTLDGDYVCISSGDYVIAKG